jgi:hypothetical protein
MKTLNADPSRKKPPAAPKKPAPKEPYRYENGESCKSPTTQQPPFVPDNGFDVPA